VARRPASECARSAFPFFKTFVNTNTLIPDWISPTTPLRHTWAPVGNIDQFRWLSRADVQSQLTMARDELGVRHVRAVAMYSPELAVWDHDLADWRKPSAEKSKRANWQMVDLSIEALLDLGLKPIYTTCFTPVGMTDDPTVCWPDKNPTGLPRDLAQWQGFVSGGIRHHIARYGIDEVRSWYFECWNEPNLKGCFFGGTKEEFFQLWSATWHAVKSVDSKLRFGGPSTARGEWIPEFLDFTTRDGNPPDYLITHVYNNDSEGEPLSPFDGPASHKVKDSPHFASGVVRGLRRELDRRGWAGEVHWNEWGRSWFLMDPQKETALEAAFIVKTMAEVSQEADAFAFWCLSDIYNQGGFQSSEFQGNYGMLSLHGLRKPAWFAHMLLERLGTERVPVRGEDELIGAVATTGEGGAKVLVYAYPEKPGTEPVSETVRVAVPPGAGLPRLTRLGAAENNIIAMWRTLGAPDYPTPAQLDQLRAANILETASAEALCIEDGHAVFTIERPGVALIEC
jgi:xylan 1,4-beta-xylosidase